MPKTAVVGPRKNMARLTKVYNTDDDDSSYVGRRHLPLVAGDKLMVSFQRLNSIFEAVQWRQFTDVNL